MPRGDPSPRDVLVHALVAWGIFALLLSPIFWMLYEKSKPLDLMGEHYEQPVAQNAPQEEAR